MKTAEEKKLYWREYRQKASYKKQQVEIQIRWQRNHRDKYHAHHAVYRALKKGILVRPDRCSNCNELAKIHGHHTDYTRPLEVVWVCEPCHKQIHKEMI